MSIKKMLLLAGMALAAAALVAPAAASAQSFQLADDGVPVNTEDDVVNMTGFAQFTSTIVGIPSGIKCDVHAVLTPESSTTGKTAFEITTDTCAGFGFLNGCTVEEDELTTPAGGHPGWLTHVASQNTLTVTNVVIHGTNDPNCFLEEITLEFPVITATVDDPEAISSATISGIGKANSLTATASGELEVVGGDAETYEIIED